MKFWSLLATTLLITACATKSTNRSISSREMAENNCDPKIVHGAGEIQKCYVHAGPSTKAYYIFRGKGKVEDIQYAHGYLLAEDINRGSLEEMKGHFKREEEKMGKNKWLFNALKDCQMKRLKKSVSTEFMQNVSAVSRGYLDGMKAKGLKAEYGEEDFIFTLLGIEFGNVMGAIAHRSDESTVGAMTKIIGECGLKLAGAGIKELIQGLRKEPAHDRKMGCVGLVAPESATGDGLIHGRNLDQGPLMKSWAKAPVMFLIHEEGRIPYVAAGTAGLLYPGGISGFNQHGLAVSLHQMNTTAYDSKHKKGSAEVVPYLQQRILREAKSIDEAFALVEKTNVFSSWTILISDSKTNEAASIEVSANRKVIARRRQNEIMGQSNHYIDPGMQKEHFHGNFAAYLETQSRLHQMEKILTKSAGKIDVEWAINSLASHVDYFEGERAFGRTAVKMSNIMSSVAYPAHNEFWMTVGNRRPAAHSWFVGARVNFKDFNLDIISVNKSFKLEDRSALEDSYGAAVASYMAYKVHDMPKAISELERAHDLAQRDGVQDTSYIYNLARLHMMEGENERAQEYMEKLFNRRSEFHDYHKALISMYTARMRQLTKNGINALGIMSYAKETLEKILADSLKNKTIRIPNPATPEYEEARFEHAALDLKHKIKVIKAWMDDKDEKIPALDFGVND